MKVTYRDGIYIAVCTLDENHAPQKAGFSLHPGLEACPRGPATCKACRVKFKKGWWTKRAEVAVRLSAHADQFAKRALTEHIKAVEMSRATDADIDIPHPPDRDYFPYQKAGIAFMVKRDATLLGDDMGLGKSAQALGVINYDKSITNVLIVCPAALRPNWLREAKMWIVKDERLPENPVLLSYASDPAGPWQPITQWIENTGRYRWKVDQSWTHPVYLRLEARDAAGNLTRVDTKSPLVLDLSRPSARITDVEPNGPMQ